MPISNRQLLNESACVQNWCHLITPYRRGVVFVSGFGTTNVYFTFWLAEIDVRESTDCKITGRPGVDSITFDEIVVSKLSMNGKGMRKTIFREGVFAMPLMHNLYFFPKEDMSSGEWF